MCMVKAREMKRERMCCGICKKANLKGGKPSKADFIFVSRCSIRGFVEHSDIPGLGINVTTVDLLCSLVMEEAAGVHMGSEEI